MISYLLKIFVLVLFWSFIAYSYYYVYPWHIENFNWYLVYIIIIWIIYWIYKFFQISFYNKKASFSPVSILWFFLTHLLILCILFFHYNSLSLSYWITLFFKIIYYSILPVFIVLVSLWFWKKIISYLNFVKTENSIYKFILSLWIWFFSFMFILYTVWILWFYNLYIVFAIIIWFMVFSYKELLSIFKWIFEYKIELNFDEWSYLKLLTTEFLFLISTFILSVNLINIVRPFPIWWDDLWVYMNFPHLMAEAGNIIPLWWMYSWQTLTGIWYMFWSPVQAFFLNNIWWFLSFLLLVLITYDLLNINEKIKKFSFINIPMLVWLLFISMPMIVFQQAKDMKLDPWLFFVSIIWLYLLFKYYIKINNNNYLEKLKLFISDKILHKWFHLENLIIIFIIWLLAGLAFSIKFTTLLYISSIIWLMFYVRLRIFWFLWYIFLFLWIFTIWWLWSKMNVVVNPENIAWFETNFFIISFILWIISLIYSIAKNNILIFKKLLMELWVLLLWIIIALLPWIWKNISESSNLSLGSILSWKVDRFIPDYSKIYTQEELEEIKQNRINQSMSSEWTTQNEDFWRYFWYEKWINNYIKLPWNLTMQVNQWGEFTTIWFIFLALLPIILLFLPFRNKNYAFLIIFILFLEILIFYQTDRKIIDNTDLSIYADIPSEERHVIFQRNSYIFKKWMFNKDIYDINVSNYVKKSDIESLVDENNSYNLVKKRAIEAFYKEIETKVLNLDLWPKLDLINLDLTENDFKFIQELRNLNQNYSMFDTNYIKSIWDLEENIEKLWLQEYREKLINLWKQNRTINEAISDFFAMFKLPYWYIVIFLIFFLPILWIFYIVDNKSRDDKDLIYIFKMNLIFWVFYTFLWSISAFWIVWYWIVMYFSFLLSIAIWIYFLSSYIDEKEQKEFYTKLFWSIWLIFIISIYLFNSIIPHTFSNLKWAWYTDFKIWKVNTLNAPYLYHQEYLEMLFHLNIDQSKKEEFLVKYINSDIRWLLKWLEKMNIWLVISILKQIEKEQPQFTKSVQVSLNNIYKNISNPSDEFKSSSLIYRIWTFMKYHIFENNIRLLEDSLINNFNDYIYNPDINKTVENMKNLWLDYLLVDLNAATIDKDERRNLTTRYERLLSTFKSEKLELIETDSVCLKLAIEDYNKSEKTEEDKKAYMTIVWVNYESYTEDWKQINRNTKLFECYQRIEKLLENWEIDKENYNFLYNLAQYIIENKESYSDQNQLYKLLKSQVTHWYKALFKVK